MFQAIVFPWLSLVQIRIYSEYVLMSTAIRYIRLTRADASYDFCEDFWEPIYWEGKLHKEAEANSPHYLRHSIICFIEKMAMLIFSFLS